MPETVHKCPNCGNHLTSIYPIGFDIVKEMFCAKCGAKMNFISSTENPNVRVGMIHPSHILRPQPQEKAESKTEVEESKNYVTFENGKENLLVYEESAPDGFFIDVEETLKIEPFIVMRNKKGKRFYFKRGTETKDGTVLIPLNKDELAEIGIEETVNEGIMKIVTESD